MTNSEGLELLSQGGLQGNAAWSWVGSRLDRIAELEVELAEVKAILGDALEDSVMYQRGQEAALKTRRLFVWHNVLTDHTDGLAVAMAATAEEAIELLRKDGLYESKIDGIKIEGEDGWVEPEVFDVPAAAWVYGGG